MFGQTIDSMLPFPKSPGMHQYTADYGPQVDSATPVLHVDLGEYYPSAGTAGQSLNGAGKPANPGSVVSGTGMRGINIAGGATASIGGSPALALLVVVALSLFLLHLE